MTTNVNCIHFDKGRCSHTQRQGLFGAKRCIFLLEEWVKDCTHKVLWLRPEPVEPVRSPWEGV